MSTNTPSIDTASTNTASTQAAIRHLGADATAEEVVEVLRADGAVVIDNLVSPEVIDAFNAEMAPYLDACPHGAENFTGTATKRVGSLVARSETCRNELVMHPTIIGATESLLGHASNFQLHLTQVISIGPGETAQPIHRDQWAFDFYQFEQGYEVQCNTLWAGTDFSEVNGGTRVVPGSNNADADARFGFDDSVGVEMSKGSVLVYTGSVHHGGGVNTSDDYRMGINITYNVAWLRQEENQFLAVPKEMAATFDDELAKLLGYSRGAFALGYVGDNQDPLDWLHGSTEPGNSFGGDADKSRADEKAAGR